MLWTADTVMYNSVSMDAAYSGNTLIWAKNTVVAKPVTSYTQIDSASTYVLVYDGVEGQKVGLERYMYDYDQGGVGSSKIAIRDCFLDGNGNLIGNLGPDLLYLKIPTYGTQWISATETRFMCKFTYTNYTNSDSYGAKRHDGMYLTNNTYNIHRPYFRSDLITGSYQSYQLIDDTGNGILNIRQGGGSCPQCGGAPGNLPLVWYDFMGTNIMFAFERLGSVSNAVSLYRLV